MRKLMKPLDSYSSLGTCLSSANITDKERASVNGSLTVNSNDLRKITKTLGFRVPLITYLKYMKLDEGRKEAIKLGVISLIENSDRIEVRQEQCVTILNMPVNININRNEGRQEVRSSGVDPEILREQLDVLREENKLLRQQRNHYKQQVAVLKRKIEQLRTLAVAGDIRNIRRVLGVTP